MGEIDPAYGQADDTTYQIDLTARTCNGEPAPFPTPRSAGREEGDHVELSVRRASGRGTINVMSDEAARFKHCKATAPKS